MPMTIAPQPVEGVPEITLESLEATANEYRRMVFEGRVFYGRSVGRDLCHYSANIRHAVYPDPPPLRETALRLSKKYREVHDALLDRRRNTSRGNHYRLENRFSPDSRRREHKLSLLPSWTGRGPVSWEETRQAAASPQEALAQFRRFARAVERVLPRLVEADNGNRLLCRWARRRGIDSVGREALTVRLIRLKKRPPSDYDSSELSGAE